MNTETYRGFTITLEQDQFAENPTEWGSYEIYLNASLNLVGPDTDRFYDANRNLTIGTRAMLKSGRLWPIRYSEHGLCRYALAYDATDCDGFIKFEPDYIHNTPKADRELYAKQDLETYTAWANGDTWGHIITDPYGDVVDDDGTCFGFYGQDDALQGAKQVIDTNIQWGRPLLAPKAKHAGELHR